MKSIIWKEYLKKDGLNICGREDIEKEENEIGFTLPETLKKMMMEHGGQSPENLLPKFPNGKSMSMECLYHAYGDDEKYDSYTISFSASCLAEDDYVNYVPFSDKGNVFLALDYNVREIEPPVVFVFRDSLPEEPEHRYFLADNFDEFLDKYTA